ncbi:hypothetical protein LR69_04305 [Geobacillus sp. BCO2]|nr:hypothetical protein LR69_04305 [Geobacillus sp. BCO2]
MGIERLPVGGKAPPLDRGDEDRSRPFGAGAVNILFQICLIGGERIGVALRVVHLFIVMAKLDEQVIPFFHLMQQAGQPPLLDKTFRAAAGSGHIFHHDVVIKPIVEHFTPSGPRSAGAGGGGQRSNRLPSRSS